MKNFSETLNYLYGLEKFGIVFGLENIEWILGLLGNPEESFPTVHVAGTNGKGSTVRMIAGILENAGYRVGRYTSPHLVSFTERIAINGREITEEEVVEITEYMKEKIDRAGRERFFTFFDFTTALAFEYFSRKKTEVAVIEVGLGGRLDSTNVIRPLVSVITNVAFDHTEYLGETIAEIAAEKAGIIKDGIPVVSGCEGAAERIVEKMAKESRSQVFCLGRDFSYGKIEEQHLSYSGLNRRFDDLYVNLKGDHQLTNGVLALCATEVISDQRFPVTDTSIRRGLADLTWPGRLEVVREQPLVILDAAHNPHGVKSLSEYMRTHFAGRKKVLIFGVMKDKNYSEMFAELRTCFDMFILTKPETERALFPSELRKIAPDDAVVTENVRSALETAKRMSGSDDILVVSGSFYTVGEARGLVDEIF